VSLRGRPIFTPSALARSSPAFRPLPEQSAFLRCRGNGFVHAHGRLNEEHRKGALRGDCLEGLGQPVSNWLLIKLEQTKSHLIEKSFNAEYEILGCPRYLSR
jgi:hypothetical protein